MPKKTVRSVIIPILKETVYTKANNATIATIAAYHFNPVSEHPIKRAPKSYGNHTPGVSKQSQS